MTNEPSPELREAFGLWQNEGLHPLTTVRGYAHLLQLGHLGPLTEQQQHAIDNILTSTQRAIEVWHRTAAYLDARYSSRDSEPLVVSAILDEVQHRLQPYGIMISRSIPDGLPYVFGRQPQLVTALCYLLYPLDHIHYCTNTAPSLSIQTYANQTLGVHLTSALQLSPQEQEAEKWLWYPGSCLNTAAIIIHQYNSSIITNTTDAGVTFAFTLPVTSC
jgi:light-regulated signal transduction histidine kinase (bacteriophytochrome)